MSPSWRWCLRGRRAWSRWQCRLKGSLSNAGGGRSYVCRWPRVSSMGQGAEQLAQEVPLLIGGRQAGVEE